MVELSPTALKGALKGALQKIVAPRVGPAIVVRMIYALVTTIGFFVLLPKEVYIYGGLAVLFLIVFLGGPTIGMGIIWLFLGPYLLFWMFAKINVVFFPLGLLIFAGYISVAASATYERFRTISRLLVTVGLFIFIFSISAVLLPNSAWAAATQGIGGEQSIVYQIIQTQFKGPAERVGIAVTDPFEEISRYWDRQIALATGDYYTSTVDASAEEPVGVFLEQVRPAEFRFYQDRPVLIYALLKARVVDTPITIQLSCKGGPENVTGSIRPRDRFYVEDYEERDIDCTLPAGMNESVHKAAFGAEFDFKPRGYIRATFMDKDRLRALRRQDIDPLTKYGIRERTPVAVTTRGPVRIGMRLGATNPIGIDRTEEAHAMLLGITVDNNWQGKILELNRMVLIVPKGILVEDISKYKVEKSSCAGLPIGERQGCDDGIHTVYKATDPRFFALFRELSAHKTFHVGLLLPANDYETFLGKGPLIVQNFKVTVEYTYAYEETAIFSVKKQEDI